MYQRDARSILDAAIFHWCHHLQSSRTFSWESTLLHILYILHELPHLDHKSINCAPVTSHEQISHANPEVLLWELFTAVLRATLLQFFSNSHLPRRIPRYFFFEHVFDVARYTYGSKFRAPFLRVNPRGIRPGKSVNRRDGEVGAALRAPGGSDDWNYHFSWYTS